MEKEKKIILHIEGMDCAHCAISISKTIEKRGLKDVNVNFATGEGSFLMPAGADVAPVIDDIQKLGYKVVRENEEKKKDKRGLAPIEKKFLFCLLFTVPLLLHMFVHAGILDDPWFQFALCLPVFTMGALHFGKSALGSLRAGMPNMDVLIIIGTSAAFFYSVSGSILFSGTAEVHNYIFYETSATIITLVLLGNVMEHRSVKQTTTAISELTRLQKVTGKRIFLQLGREQLEEVEAKDLRPGDLLQVNTGDRIAVDGIIISGGASIDESMITGESVPVQKNAGNEIVGGTIIADGNIRMKVTKVGDETLLSQIIELVKNAQNKKPSIQRLGDKISAVFVPVVLFISLLTFCITFFFLHLVLQQCVMQSIAVLVISCPCAMGLAAPTAVMVGIGRAAKNGILIKGGATLEQFSSVKNIVFDKTGTLTTGKFKIKKITADEKDIQEAVNVLYHAELHSSHPIAASVVHALRESITEKIIFLKTEELKGRGMHVRTENGDEYEIGSANILGPGANHEHDIYLLKNGALFASVDLEDELKKDSSRVIEGLKKEGITTVLLSGDSKRKCDLIAEKTGIEKIFCEQSPVQKPGVIEELMRTAPTAMIGDGINDGPALAKATVGISISNASQVAIQSAQIILLRSSDLSQLDLALRISRHTVLTIKQNFFWAFFYNAVAIPIAAFGFLDPMMGALVMAFSDVIVIGNSIRLKTKKL